MTVDTLVNIQRVFRNITPEDILVEGEFPGFTKENAVIFEAEDYTSLGDFLQEVGDEKIKVLCEMVYTGWKVTRAVNNGVFYRCRLEEMEAAHLAFHHCHFVFSDLNKSLLNQARFEDTNLFSTLCQYSQLEKSNWINVDGSLLNLSYANLKGTNWTKVHAIGAVCNSTSFCQATFKETSFIGTSLVGADFKEAVFQEKIWFVGNMINGVKNLPEGTKIVFPLTGKAEGVNPADVINTVEGFKAYLTELSLEMKTHLLQQLKKAFAILDEEDVAFGTYYPLTAVSMARNILEQES